MSTRPVRCIALIASAILAASCSTPPPPDPYAPRAVTETARWRVSRDGTALGHLLLLEIDDPTEPIRMYRAENTAGQWLGYLDANLGVYQRVPFEESEVFHGIYPMKEGLALLYEVDGPVDLTPVDRPAAAEASVHIPAREDR